MSAVGGGQRSHTPGLWEHHTNMMEIYYIVRTLGVCCRRWSALSHTRAVRTSHEHDGDILHCEDAGCLL